MKRLFWVMLAVGLSTPVWAGVKVDETNSTYDLRGLTTKQIHDDIMKSAPQENGETIDGEMNDDVSLSLNSAMQGDTCRIASDQVTLKLIIALPRWVDEGRASDDVRKAWNAYFSVLKAHEEGHKAIALKAANAIDGLIHADPSAQSCADLETKIKKAAEKIQIDAEAEQESLDQNAKPFDLE